MGLADDPIENALDHLAVTDVPNYWIRELRRRADVAGLSLDSLGISKADLEQLRQDAFRRNINHALAQLRLTGWPMPWDDVVWKTLADSGSLTLTDFGLTKESYQSLVAEAWRRTVPVVLAEARAETKPEMRLLLVKELINAMRQGGLDLTALSEDDRRWVEGFVPAVA